MPATQHARQPHSAWRPVYDGRNSRPNKKGTDSSNELDGDLNRYSALIRTLAEKNKLPLIDLRKVFLNYSKANNPDNKESGILTTDRVHLNGKGSELVAAEMWKAVKEVQ
jgi:lysophospholipase L1-like esterase